MTSTDPDATYCTEIESTDKRPGCSQSLMKHLGRESASQPVTGSHHYNTRRRSQQLSQDETQIRKREREKELAFLRLRLNEIQNKLRKADVGEEESPALEHELEEISEKMGDKRTKNVRKC